MSKDTSITLSRNTKAGGLVGATVFLASFFPVFVAFSSTESPFLFGCAWQIGLVLGLAAFLIWRYSDLLRSSYAWRQVWHHIPRVAMVMWTAERFHIAFFAWSANVVDVTITTVLFETSPLGVVLLTAWLFRSEGRYRKVGPMAALAFLVAVVGVALVALSHAGDVDLTKAVDYLTNATYALAGGVGLALGAAGLASLSGFGFRWGADLAADLPQDGAHDTKSLEVFGVVAGTVACNLFAIPVLALLGFARDEPVVPGTLWVALIGGPLIGSVGAITWRYGLLMATDLKIVVLVYFRPLLSLAWLYSLSLVGDVDGGLLLGGAVIIVIANLIVWAEGRQQEASSSSVPYQPREPKDVYELVAGGESSEVEFKSSLRTNTYTSETERRIEDAVLKTLAGFLNTEGGTLLIGVSDDGTPVGVEADNFENEDKMGLFLTDIVSGRLGRNSMTCIRPTFEDYEGERVLVVDCVKSPTPVYMKDNNRERFYVRTGPATNELTVSETVEYISQRFES